MYANRSNVLLCTAVVFTEWVNDNSYTAQIDSYNDTRKQTFTHDFLIVCLYNINTNSTIYYIYMYLKLKHILSAHFHKHTYCSYATHHYMHKASISKFISKFPPKISIMKSLSLAVSEDLALPWNLPMGEVLWCFPRNLYLLSDIPKNREKPAFVECFN